MYCLRSAGFEDEPSLLEVRALLASFRPPLQVSEFMHWRGQLCPFPEVAHCAPVLLDLNVLYSELGGPSSQTSGRRPHCMRGTARTLSYHLSYLHQLLDGPFHPPSPQDQKKERAAGITRRNPHIQLIFFKIILLLIFQG